MNNPNHLRYTATHEWVRAGADGLLWIGITDAAQRLLGDVVFVGEVKVGQALKAGESAGVIESVKAAFDVYAPLDGEIVMFNESLEGEPQLLNNAPFDTWIYKMRSDAPLDGLLDSAAYEKVAGRAT
jgi:glycine cleavage system H protein